MELSREGMVKRETFQERCTNETEVRVWLKLDGEGHSEVKSGIGFLDHLLTLLAGHGLFDLKLEARGDLEVDGHHTVEDIGLTLGQALKQSLGERSGIRRYGFSLLPMDESLVMVAVDLSGRPYLACDLQLPPGRIGALEVELVEEFLRALAVTSGMTLHIRRMAGKNAHHIAEAAFKGLGRALREAVSLDPAVQGVPSTKGTLV